MLALPYGAALTGPTLPRPGRNGARCARTPIGPTPGPPPPCGMQNVWCKFMWADVGTELGRVGDAHLCIEVGAVHVNLSAVKVNDGANLFDRLFKHAMRGRIGDHQRSELAGILLSRGAQIGDIDVAVVVASGDDDFHAAHLRAGRIGAVRADGIRQTLRCALIAGWRDRHGSQAARRIRPARHCSAVV